jgi:hypothetical protein
MPSRRSGIAAGLRYIDGHASLNLIELAGVPKKDTNAAAGIIEA